MPERDLAERLDLALQSDALQQAMTGDAELAPLVALARELRLLPRESFKAKLRLELERKTMAPAEQAVRQTATPRLRLRNVAAAIDFYIRAFGATEVMRFQLGDVIPYAEIRIGNSTVTFGEQGPGYPGPDMLGGSAVVMSLSVDDADAAVDRALAAGARLVMPVSDQFYGERTGQVVDPFGYTWSLSARTEELTLEEMHRRFGAPPAPRRYAREGFGTVTPYLVAKDADGLIETMKRVFDGEEKFRAIGSAGGIHCEMKVGNSMLMLGGGGPGLAFQGDSQPMAFHVYVPDCDAVYQKALAAGMTSIHAPMDQEYGERSAGTKDQAGNTWYMATANGESYTPEGLQTVNVYMHPLRADALIRFLERAFGAVEQARYASPDGVVQHARVKIGDTVVEMGEAHGPYQPMPGMFFLFVPNVDAGYRQALGAGAVSMSEPADQPYGDRSAAVKDMFGNQWYLATHTGS